MNWLVNPDLVLDYRPSLPASRWQRGLLLLGLGLILVLAFSYDQGFLRKNAGSARLFFSSGSFLFFCLAAGALSLPGMVGRRYEICIVLLASLYSFLFFGDYLLLVHMSGDSICQVAYWNILFRPQLTGSIGVAFAKPGQVILLGLLYQLSLMAGHLVFKIGLCLVMAACVWSLAAVATELGGRVAGGMAFVLSLWAFQTDFVFSGSAIYAIATLFAGLRFYYYHPRWHGLGRLLLVLAIQFRIEAVAVLAVVWLIHLARRQWRELWIFTAWSLLSLLLFVGIILKIQGSLARLNSGAAAGYVGPVMGNGKADLAITDHKFRYLARVIGEEFSGNSYLRFLFMLAIAGICGAFSFARGYYLSVFGSLLVVVANVFFLGGTFNLERYCDLVYAFGCSIGAGAMVRYADLALRRRKFLGGVGIAVMLLLMMAGFDYGRFNTYHELDPASTSEAFASAMGLLQDENLPPNTRLLSEDDLLAHLVVIAPDRFPRLTSLQYFNVAGDSKRREILAHTDYIWVDLNGFPYYYLFHLPRPEWRTDPFRQMVEAMVEGRSDQQGLYGCRFVTVDISYSRLLLKVER